MKNPAKEIVDRAYNMIVRNQELSSHMPLFNPHTDILTRKAEELAHMQAQLIDAAVLKYVPRWGMRVWRSPLPKKVRILVLQKAMSQVEVRHIRQSDPLKMPLIEIWVGGNLKETVKSIDILYR